MWLQLTPGLMCLMTVLSSTKTKCVVTISQQNLHLGITSSKTSYHCTCGWCIHKGMNLVLEVKFPLRSSTAIICINWGAEDFKRVNTIHKVLLDIGILHPCQYSFNTDAKKTYSPPVLILGEKRNEYPSEGHSFVLIYINYMTMLTKSSMTLFADYTTLYIEIDNKNDTSKILNDDLENIQQWAD